MPRPATLPPAVYSHSTGPRPIASVYPAAQPARADETLRAVAAVVAQARQAGSNLRAEAAMGEIARLLQASDILSPHLPWTEAQTALFFAET